MLWQLQPTIMQHPVITWIPIWQNSAFSSFLPNKKSYTSLTKTRHQILFCYYEFIEIWNSSSNWSIPAEVADAAFIRCVWRAVGNIKTQWSLNVIESVGHHFQENKILYTYCNPTAYFKDMSWNSGGQLLIQFLDESGIDNRTLQNALLCLLTLKLTTPMFLGDVILHKSLFNVWKLHSSLTLPAFGSLVCAHSHKA